MRADRLLSIMLLLQARGKASSRELAGLLEVSVRTVVRDMEALSMSGVPVFAERGRDGGWMLPEGYRTSLTGMKPAEIGSLLLAADSAVIEALGIKDDYSSAVRKLEAAGATPQSSQIQLLNQRIHIDGAAWHPSGEAYPYLSLLQEAVWTDRKVSIVYSNNGEHKERLISPLGLIAKRGVWYAAAESGGELRTYRVSRIISAEITGNLFTRPEGFELARYWEESTASFRAALPRYPATLLLSSSGEKILRQERYVTVQTTVQSFKEGWQEVQAEFQTLESACKILLSLGQEAAATAPPELVDMLKAALRETCALYEEITQTLPAGESGP
ncbi:YafY family protein [Paenibacillus sp. FSL R7-0273]|uniref:helix-turn-helix transcriptional regulator n=1 Tax=Paenibacillus sp. FSL R7-0273 TaxID=1536772 RepID=UPI00063F50F8|nr:YafY family protein [Paenibacillus sp. FSL R7-0273]OMF91971.1 transcriptional regulator [Paenibacillus sp. FSL R7-0273]